jgi:two-component system heavy metal sensor histidine kinase CusS
VSKRPLAVLVLATLVAFGLAFVGALGLVRRQQVRRLDQALLAMATEAADRAVGPDGDLVLADARGPGFSDEWRVDADRAEPVRGGVPDSPARPRPEGRRERTHDAGPIPLYGAVYDELGTPRAATGTFEGEAPRSGVLHPGREPFDLARGPLHLRAVMVPVPKRPGASLLLAMARDDVDADAALFAGALTVVLVLAAAWCVGAGVVLARRLRRDHAREIVALQGELASKNRFLAFAAHELRAPLTLVHGQLALALRRPRQVDEYRSAIGEALDAASHLRTLTEDLLDLERARGQVGPVEPVVVARIVRLAARHVHATAQARLVSVELHTQPAFVLGRAPDVERLVRNLLENAVRHAPPGGRVVLEARARDGRVEIAVHDDGAGVAEADRGKLFEPFFRGAGAPEGEGAGLGLAIAREIARAHGGDVRLDEGAERGARFVIDLPGAAIPPGGHVEAASSVAQPA